MSALGVRIQISKVTVTDSKGIEHVFEGEGYAALRGYGNVVEAVEANLKLGEQ